MAATPGIAEVKKIGLIGLDTSHVIGITQLLNDTSRPDLIPGGRVVVGFPAGSPDMELSHGRIEDFSYDLREKHGVEIVDSIGRVAEASDVIFITSVDGRTHLEQFEEAAKFRKPTFIDKPLALSVEDGQRILQLAKRYDVPVMSASAMRYADWFLGCVGDDRSGITGVDIYAPTPEEPTQRGLFWYGIHAADMMVAAMGVGCEEVRSYTSGSSDLVSAMWRDGRVGFIRGFRRDFSNFGITVYRNDGARTADRASSRQFYLTGLVKAAMNSLPQGKSLIPPDEMLEVLAILQAANLSRERNGTPIRVASLLRQLGSSK